MKNVGCETQARAIVPVSKRVADAILASGREEEHCRRMAYESAASNVLDEDTTMRHDDVMIRGSFRSTAPGLVRAAADARYLDQL